MKEARALVKFPILTLKNISHNYDWGIKALDVYFILLP
jgi:hypothetical protein